ncbi:MAG: type IV pilus modification protein PilV [Chromatiales bacterium]
MRRERGFTLLETLIALVVLSIGLLGLAALQARAMRYNHDALVRSDATALASDIMDRMRARAYNLTGSDAENALSAYVGAAPAGACATTPVTAAVDVKCWLDAIQDPLHGLPGGAAANGTITMPAGAANGDPTDDVYQIDIQWANREDPANPVQQFFTFQP